MRECHTVYVADEKELENWLKTLKLRDCPHCKRSETLNRHGSLKGHDTGLKASEGKLLRGRRVYCSNRGQRQGCGKTFPVLFSSVLKGHLVGACTLSGFLKKIAAGASISKAWEQSTSRFCLENGYRLIRRFEAIESFLRTTLCQKRPPPEPGRGEAPLCETINHLMDAFTESSCEVAAFQQYFGRGFFSD